MADQTISDTQIEAAAKAYCAVNGLDPDELVWGAYPLKDNPVKSLRWKIEAAKIRDYIRFQEALKGAGIFL